jgi:uncharacterized membrane protein
MTVTPNVVSATPAARPGAARIDSPVVPGPAAPSTSRLASLDIVRGVVMVLMAIDHVRVYSGVPAGGPTPGIFFTRWVTHFCAPAFAFFAGTAAFLYGERLMQRGLGRGGLARYLLSRGVLLVLLELTVIHVAWTFTFDFTHLLAGVIWMLGWSMILMAGLVQFSPRVVGVTGLVLILAQNVLGFLAGAMPPSLRPALGWVWQFLYTGGEVRLGAAGPAIGILYVIVPWIGVMAAGYGFGAIMVRGAAERRRLCLRIGLWATALFVLVAGLAMMLRPAPAGAPPALIRMLNQQKYPASQLFLLMTLGPTIALLPVAERARGWMADVLATFGRVPMFYYLLHIPLIHAVGLLVWLARTGNAHYAALTSAPYVSIPAAERWGLPLLYLVFALVIALLYAPCRWYAAVKARNPGSWLRYI